MGSKIYQQSRPSLEEKDLTSITMPNVSRLRVVDGEGKSKNIPIGDFSLPAEQVTGNKLQNLSDVDGAPSVGDAPVWDGDSFVMVSVATNEKTNNVLTSLSNITQKIIGKNKFDKSKANLFKYVSDDGLLYSSETLHSTDFIPVKSGDIIYGNYGAGNALRFVAFYDENKIYIQNSWLNYPSNGVECTINGYAIISFTATLIDTYQIELGGISEYEEYYEVAKRNSNNVALTQYNSNHGFYYFSGSATFGNGTLQTTNGTIANIDIPVSINDFVAVDVESKYDTYVLIMFYNGDEYLSSIRLNKIKHIDETYELHSIKIESIPLGTTRTVISHRASLASKFKNLRISNNAIDGIGEFPGMIIETNYAKELAGIKQRLKGKKLCTIGDSITCQKTWQPELCRLTGLVWNSDEVYSNTNETPLALGGSTIVPVWWTDADWSLEEYADFGQGIRKASIHYRADYVAAFRPDVIILFGGQNDSAINLGSIDDAPYLGPEVQNTSGLVPSFYASYKGVLKKLTTQNPNAIIICMTTTQNWYYNPEKGYSDKKLYWDARNNAIKECAALYSCKIVDLNAKLGINYDNAYLYFKADNDDESWIASEAGRPHPNELGGIKIAEAIASII